MSDRCKLNINSTEHEATQHHDDYSSDPGISSFGGEEDLWGLGEIDIIDLNSQGFEVIFDADLGPGLLAVDAISIELFYSIPLIEYSLDSTPPYVEEGAAYLGCTCRGDNIVLVGSSGLIAVSEDKGETWTEEDSGIADNLWAVDSHKGLYTAVGENGAVVVSGDRSNWTRQDSGIKEHLFSVSCNGSACAVGRDLSLLHRRTPTSGWINTLALDQLTGRVL